MTRKSNKKLLSLILSTMLIVAMAFSMTACGGNDQEKPNTEVENQVNSTEQDAQSEVVENSTEDVTVLGEGTTVFSFIVVDGEGEEATFEIHTDKAMVGEALLELELIEGEEGAYGLYVKTVNGITADYDLDQTYWGFYINGEMAMTGVDATEVEAGATYSFKVEK